METTYLDTLTPIRSQASYGTVGIPGDLRYEGKQIYIAGQIYCHALSTHPPARLVFELNGATATFIAKWAE